MIYSCCDELRRNQIAGTGLNGINYLEVLDGDAINLADRQKTLYVHFINDLAPGALTEINVRIEGGERIRNIVIDSVTIGMGSEAKILTVAVDQPGDEQQVGDGQPEHRRLVAGRAGRRGWGCRHSGTQERTIQLQYHSFRSRADWGARCRYSITSTRR